MKVTYRKGDDYMTLDNEGHVIGNVKIEGSNLEDVDAVHRVVNEMHIVRGTRIESFPDGEIVIDENGVAHIDTASDRYMETKIPKILARRGYFKE